MEELYLKRSKSESVDRFVKFYIYQLKVTYKDKVFQKTPLTKSIVIEQMKKNEGIPRIIKIARKNLGCLTNSSDLIVGCKI